MAKPASGEHAEHICARSNSSYFHGQAKNDFNLGPSEVIGAQIKKKPGLNWSRVYPAFGTTHRDGHHGFAVKATDVGALMCLSS